MTPDHRANRVSNDARPASFPVKVPQRKVLSPVRWCTDIQRNKLSIELFFCSLTHCSLPPLDLACEASSVLGSPAFHEGSGFFLAAHVKESPMPRDQYFVVLHEGKWKITHNGSHSHPYATQQDALDAAIDAAKTAYDHGRLSQVLVQGENMEFREEWTYGKDPFPTPG